MTTNNLTEKKMTQMFNFKQRITMTNPSSLKKQFDALLSEAWFSLLWFQDHHFSPQGYTALWLLGESHFALHTFPEDERTYIELTSCNKEYYDFFIVACAKL